MELDRIFQVSEFNEFINIYLEGVGEIVVEGEISQVNISKRIFLFAKIKDKESSVDIFGITHQLPGYDLLEEGMLVHVYGRPNLYKASGRFSIKATRIVPAGEGALKLAFDKLKKKLDAEGLFSVDRKRELTKYPQKIGLLTAKGSRAYSDFIKVLKNRMGGISIMFVPIHVQGKDSVDSIVAGIKTLNRVAPDLDFMVITRGGGSLEDLQSFNDERVARAVYSSKVPVVSAIGHEDDVSISDMVADLRASTPSNAAEITIPDRGSLLRTLNYQVANLDKALYVHINKENSKLRKSIGILNSFFTTKIYEFNRLISQFRNHFALYIHSIDNSFDRIKSSKRILSSQLNHLLLENVQKADSLYRLISSLSYENILSRGFSITYDENGSLIDSVKKISKNQNIVTKLSDGNITSVVTDTKGV